MGESGRSKREALVREVITFQLKILADGLRDLVLVPFSVGAAMIGFLRGGEEPGREFRQVLGLGRQADQWINLFGDSAPTQDSGGASSIDDLFAHLETALKQQYKARGISTSTQAAIDEAMQVAHKNASAENPDEQA